MTASALIGCRTCGLVHSAVPLAPGEAAVCHRCGTGLEPRRGGSLALTAAFSSAALLLYWPANAFPILRMNMDGAVTENTVWQGCVNLYRTGDAGIALIVFLASVVIPFMKLLGLLLLAVTSRRPSSRWRRTKTRLYLAIDAVGRWAMLDVFALAVMVSLVRLQGIASVVPGKGAAAFAAVVVLTILAGQCFDPRLIWDEAEAR